jgi:hypothetical protein
VDVRLSSHLKTMSVPRHRRGVTSQKSLNLKFKLNRTSPCGDEAGIHLRL